MNRINYLFSRKKKNILSIYFTSGFPKLHDTLDIVSYLEESGVDMIEVGIPFSDPIADGSTIQKSNNIAIRNGMTIELLFEQLENLRNRINLPIILMGYLNPIFQFGIQSFCEKCNDVGVDGLIIPDLPMIEYHNTLAELMNQNNLKNIFLITPQTSSKRIALIDEASNSFIYVVSSLGTTGSKEEFNHDQLTYFERIWEMNLKNPKMIGFGVYNDKTFRQATQYAQGAIVGSEFINLIANSKDLKNDVFSFIKVIKNE